ncbi:unnamed protein product [Cuscuta campestris]|uniref:DUF1985 domain-containing protein n=1 Tax=Cuscuta campestris TaxID=132261 RepID=A0A484NKH6_9ASTE|nr:unnamed protein product [Cuscuta campestris]
MMTRSSAAKKIANRELVDDDDDFVDKIPIIKTMNLVKTTSGRVYKRLCNEEVLVGKATLKRSGDVDRIKFHIGDRIVEFKKSDFALITGLKFGKEAEYGDTDLEKANDISSRYFNGKMSVTRIQVENVFNSIKNSRGRERLDAVKLALLNFLVNYVVGNQGLTKIPALYMHLVNDLRRFNGFQWGEHLWNDMVESLRKCSSILNTGEHCHFTFPGFLFPLQIWAFETFPSLRENGICIVGQKRSSLWLRALRWETGKRPMHDLLEGSIFGIEKESVQWTKMAATTEEKGKPKIAMLFTAGDANKAKINDGGGEHVDEGYGAGRRKLKGKLHWGNVNSTNEEEINVQPKGKGKVVIHKKTKGQKTEKKTDGSLGGASGGAPQGRQSDLGEAQEIEPSLRDIMTAIVVMEKRNMKMRTEVTKLRIALNAQIRVLNRFITMNRMEKKDDTEPDVDDDVWDEGINVDAEIGTQPGKCPERNVENEECGKGTTHMVEDDMLNCDVGTGIGVEEVLRTGVDETKAASPVNGDMSAMNMSGHGNEIKEDVAGFTDKFERVSQVVEAVQDLPTGCIFFTQPGESPVQIEKNSTERNVDRNSAEGVINDSTDEVYEAPIASKTPPEWSAKQKRPLKCPDRASGRKYKVPDDVLDPGLYKVHYDEEDTLTKTWYYNIFFPWGWLSDKHLDVVFYYLRMKGVEFGMEQRYTTTDTPFLALMKTLCGRSSCGMFVVKMAEFLMMGCDVGDMDDHKIAAYTKKMTVELLAYSAV